MILPIVLSGGSGTRLWPLSRGLYPKQLLPLVTEKTMLQETVLRLQDLGGGSGSKGDALECGSPLIVCNEAHRFLIAEQMRTLNIEPRAILLEPVGRNTAPAVAVGAMHLLSTGGDSVNSQVMLVLPADHVIRDQPAFHRAVQAGAHRAQGGDLVTFGIVPDRAETGYGYLRKGAPKESAYEVDCFVEKPDATTAKEYLDSGEYLWNSGMFMFRVDALLGELAKFAPDMVEQCRASVMKAQPDLDFVRLGTEAFSACPSDSIDYALMEKTDKAVVVPIEAGWSDVGDWSSLHATKEADEDNNVTVGDVILENCEDCYAHSSSRMVAAVGLKDHVIVETSDAVMVAPKGRSQDVKAIVERLKKANREEVSLHREVFRPWGSFDSIDSGSRYQVKRLSVKPGAVLSLQMHHHRAEHWVVVRGTAMITRGEEEFLLTENQSTYIPLGTVHRIANPGNVPLDIIEVQSGSYLGEDDIVRLDDTYGRVGRTD